ncbi:MAG: zf-HC2 domain-containing protein [Elusimicrobiota bacterium]
MNDSDREKLSAYLDGALSDAERRAVEVEISRSEEMRLELEALRAVSATVKGLPKEELPVGFMARLEARRAREGSGAGRDYLIPPPSYRPLAFALSTAVVALVVWDKTRVPEEMIVPRASWDSETIAVKSAAANEITAQTAKKEDAAKPATFGKHISAPGKPLEFQESDGAGARSMAGRAGLSAPSGPAAAAPAPAPAPAAADGESSGYLARNEEERSAINERLYKGFEEEKKRMGIAKIMDKDAEEDKLSSGGREFMALQATPEPARVGRARGSTAAVRGMAKAKGGAPAIKALTLKTAESLQAAWDAAGLSGEPPAVDFPGQMAVFLAGPSGCGIVDVQVRRKFIVVLYKDAGFDDASARVRALALSPKPVVVKPAE